MPATLREHGDSLAFLTALSTRDVKPCETLRRDARAIPSAAPLVSTANSGSHRWFAAHPDNGSDSSRFGTRHQSRRFDGR